MATSTAAVFAQGPGGHAGHHPAASKADGGAPAGPPGRASRQGQMMGKGTGPGMMGMCPGMVVGAKVDVTKTAKGVTITITSDDPKTVAQIQKKAEAMRLMHEAHEN